MSAQLSFNNTDHDESDPNPWLALYLDNSIPINDSTKKALMRDNNSRSARLLMPIIRLWSQVTMFFIHLIKFVLPKFLSSSKYLHRILSWGLKHFVSPDANLLIFRHFHVGSEILEFVAKNIDGIQIKTSPLKPYNFEDVKDDLFLDHDLNLYNFVIKLNSELKAKNIALGKAKNLDLNMISENQFNHITFPNSWTNILDLRSAIELFTPFYQLFLSSNDFIRASNSLQLDETIAIYSAKILGTPAHLGLVNNKHPMVPQTTFSVAYNLVLHGLAAETLHEILVLTKQGKMLDGVIVPNI